MKAVRLHAYGENPVLDEVAEPTVTGPWDVVVDVGAAGLCRTDLHIIEGQWDPIQHPSLPYILGHENAGWVREVRVRGGFRHSYLRILTCGQRRLSPRRRPLPLF